MSPYHYSGDGDRIDHAVSPIPQRYNGFGIPHGSGTHAKRTVAALIASELRSSAGRYSARVGTFATSMRIMRSRTLRAP